MQHALLSKIEIVKRPTVHEHSIVQINNFARLTSAFNILNVIVGRIKLNIPIQHSFSSRASISSINTYNRNLIHAIFFRRYHVSHCRFCTFICCNLPVSFCPPPHGEFDFSRSSESSRFLVSLIWHGHFESPLRHTLYFCFPLANDTVRL